MASLDGLAVVDKPSGFTSHDVVARLRRQLGERRIGHSGTLDPDATGVLLCGVGRVTRLLRFLTVLPKSYIGEVVLGVETTTLDAAGDVTATHDMGEVTLQDVLSVARRFVGDIEQIPPMVSAVKVGGRRLHELARAGEEVEREPRPVTVHALGVEPTDESDVFRIALDCSSGTYVRVIAADIGAALGGGAHLRNLRRIAIGSFTLADAASIDEITAASLLAPAAALRDYEAVTVDNDTAAAIGHGKVLPVDALGGVTGPGPWAVLNPAGRLLAVYEDHGDGTVKPAVVLSNL